MISSKRSEMEFPLEIVVRIFSFGHPWDFKYYSQVSKLFYEQAKQIKEFIIDDMPNKSYLSCNPSITYSDIMKLSLLYNPIPESIGKYDSLTLYYYAVSRGRNTDFIRLPCDAVSQMTANLIRWKFKIQMEESWSSDLLSGLDVEISYSVANLLWTKCDDIPKIQYKGLVGPGGYGCPTLERGVRRYNNLKLISSNYVEELLLIIAICEFLTFEDKFELIYRINQQICGLNKLDSSPIYKGVIGSGCISNYNLHAVGSYLTYQYIHSQGIENTEALKKNLQNILHCSHEINVHDFPVEISYDESELGIYYILSGNFHKYYERKHKLVIPTKLKRFRSLLGVRSFNVDLKLPGYSELWK